MKKEQYHRRQLVKDMLVVQLKLWLDTAFDILMAPALLIAGAIDIARNAPPEDRALRKMLKTGRTLEHWINLFGDPDETTSESDTVTRWVHDAERKMRAHGKRRRQGRSPGCARLLRDCRW